MSWGLLIESVEKMEGMRGRRRWAVMSSRMDACVYGGPCLGSTEWGLALRGRPGMNLRV